MKDESQPRLICKFSPDLLSVYRVILVSYFAMRSVNRIIKITFLVNFDWMSSLSEGLVISAAIITTVLSILGRNDKHLCSLSPNLSAVTCVLEYFYREKYHLWHIGLSDQSAYLYNLTGTEKLQLEAETTRSTG